MQRIMFTLLAALLLLQPIKAQTSWAPALEATSEGSQITITWTHTATDAATYTVERSKFGELWEAISTTDRLETINTTVDASPLHGLSYYRIAKTDAFGQRSTSNSVPVRMEHNALDFSITPHPSRGNFFTIALNNRTLPGDAPMTISVVDLAGQYQLREENASFNRNGRLVMRPAQTLKSGMYVVVIERGAQRCARQLLVVND